MKKYIFSEEYEGRGHKRQRDWFYLVSDVDAREAQFIAIDRAQKARIAELEKALRYYRDEYSGNEPSVSVFDRMVDDLIGAR